MIGAKGRKKRKKKKKKETGRGERYNADQLQGRRKRAAIARGTNRARECCIARKLPLMNVRFKTYAHPFSIFPRFIISKGNIV